MEETGILLTPLLFSPFLLILRTMYLSALVVFGLLSVKNFTFIHSTFPPLLFSVDVLFNESVCL